MAHERPKAGISRQRFLTRDEMGRLLAAAASGHRPGVGDGTLRGSACQRTPRTHLARRRCEGERFARPVPTEEGIGQLAGAQDRRRTTRRDPDRPTRPRAAPKQTRVAFLAGRRSRVRDRDGTNSRSSQPHRPRSWEGLRQSGAQRRHLPRATPHVRQPTDRPRPRIRLRIATSWVTPTPRSPFACMRISSMPTGTPNVPVSSSTRSSGICSTDCGVSGDRTGLCEAIEDRSRSLPSRLRKRGRRRESRLLVVRSRRCGRRVASLCCCKFAAALGSRWWSVYAALTSSSVVGSLPACLIRSRRWRSSWLKRTPFLAWVM